MNSAATASLAPSQPKPQRIIRACAPSASGQPPQPSKLLANPCCKNFRSAHHVADRPALADARPLDVDALQAAVHSGGNRVRRFLRPLLLLGSAAREIDAAVLDHGLPFP